MKILCLVKQVLDSDIEPTIVDNKVDREDVSLVLNPYDTYGITEALNIKSSFSDSELTVLSVGSDLAYDALKYSLSLGADRAVLLRFLDDELASMSVSRIIYDFVKDRGFDIIFTGKKAIDDNAQLVGGILASLLGRSFVYGITSFSLSSEGRVICGREGTCGYEEIELSLPCVLSCDKGLNEPVSPSLQSIMRSRKKRIEEHSIKYEDSYSTARKSLEFNDVKRARKLIKLSVSEQVDELVSFFEEKGFVKRRGS